MDDELTYWGIDFDFAESNRIFLQNFFNEESQDYIGPFEVPKDQIDHSLEFTKGIHVSFFYEGQINQ